MAYTWDAEAHAVLDPGARGLVRILGGPGTGKSSLLVDAAVGAIGGGIDPKSVLLLTGSGRMPMAARALRTTSMRPRMRCGRTDLRRVVKDACKIRFFANVARIPQTRAAPCVAWLWSRWYKERAAIQADQLSRRSRGNETCGFEVSNLPLWRVPLNQIHCGVQTSCRSHK